MAALATPISKFKKNHAVNPQSPSLTLPASPFLEKLGYGTGVQVYLYDRPVKNNVIRSPWAVKKVTSKTKEGKLYEDRLKNEASILKNLKHENIIQFRAILKPLNGNKTCLAMEFGCEALFDRIEIRAEEKLGPFAAEKILRVGEDVANALLYLHNDKKILHGDIKSPNILVQGNFEKMKLCDFGVTVSLDEKGNATSNYIGTKAWSAMEVLMGEKITDKTEMYSFGMVFYEMLTLNIPFGHIFPNEEDFETDEEFEEAMADAEEEYDSLLGTRPTLPDTGFKPNYLPIIEIMYTCTDECAKKRPSASDVYKQIREMKPVIKTKLDFTD